MSPAARNIALYPWFKFFQNLLFWQATWFLFFQSELSAAQAILIYVFYDIATTVFEVPSGFMSDRVGRRITLILSVIAGLLATLMQGFGSGFLVFATAQIAMGAHIAFASGTDSSLLFESLKAEGREDEVETHELRAWRSNFIALAVSAVIGGAMALWDMRLPFLGSAVAFAVLLLVVFRFTEPQHKEPKHGDATFWEALQAALTQPILIWLFGLSVLMYGFSHVPFVFGQPFILNVLDNLGLAANAPLVSGSVTAAMMVISVIASIFAPSIRERLGLAGILLIAFGMQVGLIAGLSVSTSVFAISLLLLRMVPDAFSRPFILARIQPLLADNVRATYLSLQSLTGRLAFASSLYLASVSASDVDEMTRPELQTVLSAYALLGAAALIALAILSRTRKI